MGGKKNTHRKDDSNNAEKKGRKKKKKYGYIQWVTIHPLKNKKSCHVQQYR